MPNFIQLTFSNINPEQSELLIAQLAEAGYEGFEENEGSLKAFVPEHAFDRQLPDELSARHQLTFQQQLIPEQNWNAVWESNFAPVVVDDFVAIRADFHEQTKGVEQEVVITPKMSFGTGHHATTYMMVQQMRSVDFKGKKVFDFGTGTGILAILAEKLGAASVLAMDNDDWSLANAKENTEKNNCTRIDIIGGTEPTGGGYDIILANINKNVILENLASLSVKISKSGILLLSGLLADDEADILTAAGKYALVLSEKTTRGNWIALRLNH